MGGAVDDRGPRRFADHFAVVLAQTRDPRRDQHATQRRPCPPPACDWLDAAIVEVEGDAADALAAQHSCSSLLDRLGLGWLDLLADDAIPPSPTLTQIMADDLVAERPGPSTGSLAGPGVALDRVLDALAPDGRLVPGPAGLHEAVEPAARCRQVQLAARIQADLDLSLAADLHEPREVIGVTGQSIMVPRDKHVRLPSAEELDHLFEFGSEFACVAGSSFVLVDVHHVPAHALCVLGPVGYLGGDRFGSLVIFRDPSVDDSPHARNPSRRP